MKSLPPLLTKKAHPLLLARVLGEVIEAKEASHDPGVTSISKKRPKKENLHLATLVQINSRPSQHLVDIEEIKAEQAIMIVRMHARKRWAERLDLHKDKNDSNTKSGNNIEPKWKLCRRRCTILI